MKVASLSLLLLVQAQDPPPIKVADDKSLSPASYVEKGMPSAQRLWGAEDYEAALKVLQKIVSENPLELPRQDSPSSGPLFKRICDVENLSLYRNRKLPMEQRLPPLAKLTATLSQMLAAYLRATQTHGVFDAELVGLSLLVIHVTSLLFELSDEFLASLPPEEREKDARKKGLEQMRNGAATLVAGALQMLNDRASIRKEQRLRFAEGLKSSLPALVRRMTPLSQKEVPVKLRSMIDQEPDQALKSGLSGLLEALPKAPAD